MVFKLFQLFNLTGKVSMHPTGSLLKHIQTDSLGGLKSPNVSDQRKEGLGI